MSNYISKSVGIACLSMLLQISSSAKASVQTQSQDKTEKSSNSLSSSFNSDSSTQLEVVRDSSENKAKSDARSEVDKDRVISQPKVSLKNPSINLNIAPRESKVNERSFAGPEIETIGELRTFHATAYSLKGRTRSGAYVRRGVIAADPRVLPLGSVVQIKAGTYTGVYTVHDTGKKIKGNIVDLWMPSRSEARQFGRQKIRLHVLRMGTKSRVKPQ